MTRLILSALLALLIFPASTTLAVVSVTFPYDGMYDGVENDTPTAIKSGDVRLLFTVDEFGAVSMDASLVTPVGSAAQEALDNSLIDQWDLPAGSAGTISAETMWGSSFYLDFEPRGNLNLGGSVSELVVRTTDVAGVGRIGIAGSNPGLIDNDGDERVELHLGADDDSSLLNSRLQFQNFTYSNEAVGSQFELDAFRETIEPLLLDELVVDLDALDNTVDLTATDFVLKDVTDRFYIRSVSGAPGASFTGFTFDFITDLFGDIDGSGVIDQGDIDQFVLGWKTDTSALTYDEQTSAGDLNHDGITNFLDWSLLRGEFAGSGASFTVPSFEVPEPASLSILGLALGLVGLRGRKR